MDEDSLPPDFDKNYDVMYEGEIIPKYEDCPYCDGQMEWCGCCETYTSVCCIPYGTCQCS